MTIRQDLMDAIESGSLVDTQRVLFELLKRVEALEARFPTPEQREEAIVARLGVIAADDQRLVGTNPPQLYLMPGATGDPHIDQGNYENAVWNAHQRRLWEAEHGPLCKTCQQEPHTKWCEGSKS